MGADGDDVEEGADLDAAAAALVAAAPEDAAGVSRLRDLLWDLSRRVRNGRRAGLEEAAAALSASLTADVAARASALARAGGLLEKAQKAGGPAAAEPAADPALFESFVSESREGLLAAEAALLKLEAAPDDAESVNVVFRAVHTMKGTAGFLGLDLIGTLAHQAESLLSRVRAGGLAFDRRAADLCLRSLDMLTALLAAVPGGARPEGYDALLGALGEPDGAPAPPDAGVPRLGDILVAEGKADREGVERAAAAAAAGGRPLGVELVRAGAAKGADVARALETQKSLAGGEPSPGDRFVRVRTERFDRLVDAIGELVIAQSMLAQDPNLARGVHPELARKVSHASKIVRELQDLGMSMRMVPLKPTFQKMARLARDVSRRCGKLVELHADGEEVEIDRSMVEVVDELLMHMVRNAVDHGVEPSDVRRAAGKPACGRVRLSAAHSGGSVVFTVEDDGRGLERARLERKAAALGLVPDATGLTDREVYGFIFLPGFSTADRVTDISGRGVGMDVVKKGVESMRGRVEVDSEPGRGCRFTLRLPLTMAVTDGMLVRVGGERLILPLSSILRMLRPERSQVHALSAGAEVAMIQGEAVPVLRLHRLLGIDGARETVWDGVLVVVEDGERRCALLVDELLGQRQVVAKPLGEAVGRPAGIAGGAILGDGRVGVIIDPAGLVALARGRERRREERP